MALSAILQTRAFITYEDDKAPFCKLRDLILAFELGMKALVAVRAERALFGSAAGPVPGFDVCIG